MGRVLYTVALIAMGALVVHFAIIMLLPLTAPDAAGRQLNAAVPEPATAPTNLSELQIDGKLDLGLDPAFRVLACRYSITEEPLRIAGGGRVPLWTLSVLNSRGVSVFSANDRISPTPNIDVALLNANQLRTFRQMPDPALDNAIVVAPGDDDGFVIIRLFEPDNSWTALIDELVASIECSSFQQPSPTQ
ncbi:MAG: hypothetical protein AAFO77_15060 [Pseudomonadota bacterium]